MYKSMKSEKIIANIEFPVRTKEGTWAKLDLQKDILKGKKVIIFSLPGAFTPTCSSSHLPRYEALYDTFKSLGIDEIYCASVNDTFVMNGLLTKELRKLKCCQTATLNLLN